MSADQPDQPDQQHDERAEWDEKYAGRPVWSGQPNGALVAEVADLAPGRALDVGCGEGADAVWLAGLGWQVTALDVSVVAIARGREGAAAAGVDVRWVPEGLVAAASGAALGSPGFDLVSVQYPALRRTPSAEAERALLGAVAPGGTLLVVHHADVDRASALERGFDPDDYVGHEQVLAALVAAGDAWTVMVAERRAREISGGGGAHHTHDLVLRARRTR